MVNEKERVQVDIISGARVSDPMISDVMVFTLFSTLFMCANTGLLGANFILTLGVVQVSLVGLFYTGARERVKYDPFWGNMNFIFVFFFGVLGGVENILIGSGILLSSTVGAIPNLLVGMVMLFTTPGIVKKKDPWTFLLLWIFAWIGVISLGIAGLNIMPQFFSKLGGLALGGVAVLGFYALIVLMLGYTGINLSLGKAWFSQEDKKTSSARAL